MGLHEGTNLKHTHTHTVIKECWRWWWGRGQGQHCDSVVGALPSVHSVGSWGSSVRCRQTWWCSSCCKTLHTFPISRPRASPGNTLSAITFSQTSVKHSLMRHVIPECVCVPLSNRSITTNPSNTPGWQSQPHPWRWATHTSLLASCRRDFSMLAVVWQTGWHMHFYTDVISHAGHFPVFLLLFPLTSLWCDAMQCQVV